MRFWLQYHSYDNLGYLPGGYETNIDRLSTLDTSIYDLSCVSTAKSAILNAINDVVFLIVGYGKSPKKYVLWSWFVIDEVEENPGMGFNAFGDGEVLNPLPLLTGKEFDEFKKQMANFSFGFINISNRAYTQHLIELAKERGGFETDGVTTKSHSDSSEEQESEIQRDEDNTLSEREIDTLKNRFGDISEKEREVVIQARRGQGLFRRQVIEYWSTCAVTGCTEHSLLRASHIKPWAKCNLEEALDPFNGLLLSPSFDAAFDAGYISFDESGKILISEYLSQRDAQILGIYYSLCLSKIHPNHQQYLVYHRQNIFKA